MRVKGGLCGEAVVQIWDRMARRGACLGLGGLGWGKEARTRNPCHKPLLRASTVIKWPYRWDVANLVGGAACPVRSLTVAPLIRLQRFYTVETVM